MQNRDYVVITRGSIGQFASFIGAAALLIGFLGLIWQGGLTGYVIAALGIGAAGILIWALTTPREFVDFITGRQARQGTIAVFSTLLLIGIVVLGYILLERAVLTVDMTNARDFSLSDATKDVISRVNRDIRITGFYSPRRVATRELDDQIFRLFEVESGGYITRNYIDPIAQPGIAEAFRAQDGDVYVSYLNEDGTVDRASISWVPMVGAPERDMVQAIARLLVTGDFTVYFTFGHGELTPADDSGVGLSTINSLLQVNGFNTLPLDLALLASSGGRVPQNADALIIARPQVQFAQAVINVLDDYLQRGGNVFIMADAIFTDAPFLAENSLFNQYLWDYWGIRMLDAVVVDPLVSSPTPLDVISYAIYDSPITANIDPASDPDSATLFHIARAIEVNPEPPVNNGAVIQTSEVSYGETNLQALAQSNTYQFDEGDDIPGPLTTVAYAFSSERGGKVLLVGDSDFITNGRIGSPTGNAYLFTDGLGWMTQYTEQVSIGARAVGARQPLIFVDTQTLDQIAFLTLILMPSVTLMLGVGVWFRRSRR